MIVCQSTVDQSALGDDVRASPRGEVVADVAVVDARTAGVVRVLDGDEDGDGVAAAGAEDLAALLARRSPAVRWLPRRL